MVRSETIVDVESQAITPALPLKAIPEKSALELTSARMAGPLFLGRVVPRRKASPLPSTRLARASGWAVGPLFGVLFVPRPWGLSRPYTMLGAVTFAPCP